MKSYPLRMVFISFVGAVVSAYLLYHYVDMKAGFSHEPSFCSISETFDCDKVAKSTYSSLFGLPVASYGLMYYLGLIIFLTLGLRATSKESGGEDEGSDRVVSPNSAAAKRASVRFFLASLSILVSIGLALISEFLIHALCLMCMMLYAVNLILFILSWKDPERSTKGIQSLLEGLKESFGLFASSVPTQLPRFPLFGFLAGDIAFTVALPIIFLQGFILPEAGRTHDRTVLLESVKAWRAEPLVNMPDFELTPTFSPDVAFGNPKAAVTVVEFSDLECPACHRTAPYLTPALEKYRDKIRFVFKHFPLDMKCNPIIQSPKHIYACDAAKMAVCAGTQGREALWQFVDAAFKLRDVDTENLSRLPDQLKLDPMKFKLCMEGEDASNRVKADINLAISLEVNSTPTIFVNKKKLAANSKLLDGVLGLIIEEVESGKLLN